jgi:hypothetical protein
MWIMTGEEDMLLISPEGVIDHSQTILLSDYDEFRATHFSGIVTFGFSEATGNPVALCNVVNWEVRYIVISFDHFSSKPKHNSLFVFLLAIE